MPAKSFVEVLEEQIRQDLRAEIEAEVRAEYGGGPQPAKPEATGLADLAARFESTLASRVGRKVFSKVVSAKQAYGGSKPAATKAVPQRPEASHTAVEPTFTATTIEELCAIEMIKRHSSASRLGSTFTLKELKTAWRKAALATHPDRFSGSDEITRMRATVTFRELAEAYELLINEVELKTAA